MLYNVYFGLKFIYYKDKCLCIKHYDNLFLCGKSLRTVGVQTQILRNDSERSDTEGVVYRQTEPVLGYCNQGMATTLCLEWLDEFHFQQILCFVLQNTASMISG